MEFSEVINLNSPCGKVALRFVPWGDRVRVHTQSILDSHTAESDSSFVSPQTAYGMVGCLMEQGWR